MATDKKPRWKPSGNFYFAMTLAGLGHEDEVRKGSDIPYLGHLLGVASIVIEAGGSEDQAAGALLHDLLEDTPTTYDQLVKLIDEPISKIVQGCTDTTYARKQEIKEQQQVRTQLNKTLTQSINLEKAEAGSMAQLRARNSELRAEMNRL